MKKRILCIALLVLMLVNLFSTEVFAYAKTDAENDQIATYYRLTLEKSVDAVYAPPTYMVFDGTSYEGAFKNWNGYQTSYHFKTNSNGKITSKEFGKNYYLYKATAYNLVGLAVKMVNSSKTYDVGDTLDKGDFTVTAYYSDNVTQMPETLPDAADPHWYVVPLTSDAYSFESNTVPVSGDVKITYCGKEKTIHVSVKQYALSSAAEHGTVLLTVGGEKATSAKKSQTVTITITPENGYELDTLKYNDGSDHPLTTTSNVATLTMPANDVTVSATFKLIPHVCSWTYTASKSVETLTENDTITASCTGVGTCDYDGSDMTLTLTASNATYDGSAHGATLNNKTIAGISEANMQSIKYAKKNGESWEKATDTVPTDAGTYKASITVGTATASVVYTIAQVQLTVSGTTVADKAYNGSTTADATIGTIAGKVKNDDVAVSIQSATFADGNVGDNKTVTVKYQLSGEKAKNYLVPVDDSLTATISRKNLTISTETGKQTTVSGKTYDGTATAEASIGTVVGIETGDNVTVEVDTATFENKNAGENKTVTVVYKISGKDAGNYCKPTNESKQATISKKVINVTADNQSTYAGCELATLTYTADKLCSGDSFSGTLETNANKDVVCNAYTITQGNLSAGNNYSISFTPGIYTVKAPEKQTLTFADGDQTKTYGDSPFTKAVSGASTTVTYESSVPTVAAVNPATGEVTILKTGTTIITAKAAKDSTHEAAEKSYTLTVNRAPQTISAPTAEEIGENTVVLEAVKAGQGATKYGVNTKNVAPTDWQISPEFTGLSANTTYYFFAKYEGNENYLPAVSTGTKIRTDAHKFAVVICSELKDEIKASPNYAASGQTVTLTVKKNTGDFTVATANGKEVKRTKVNDTTYTFIMPSEKVIVSTGAEVSDGKCPQDETCVYAKYTDADTKAWYHDGVHFCVEKGYMNGVSKTAFAPNDTLSRAMIVTMLYRLEGEPAFMNDNVFSDVEAGAWYEKAVVWANGKGIVEGYGNDKFGPNDAITREQLAAILYRYAENKGEGFKGASMFYFNPIDRETISSWAAEAMRWCYMKQILKGDTTGAMRPTDNATRAEAACMVQRFCESVLK